MLKDPKVFPSPAVSMTGKRFQSLRDGDPTDNDKESKLHP